MKPPPLLRLVPDHRPFDPSRTSLASSLAMLIASGSARSRADLVRATGLARSTVTHTVDALLDRGLLDEAGEMARSSRGRPAQRLMLGRSAGVILVADMGVHSARLGMYDLAQRPMARESISIDPGIEPATTLRLVGDVLENMLTEHSVPAASVRALVVGLPAPVDVRQGVPVRPPIMPQWDGFPVAETLEARFGCTTLLENDANLMALGEARALPTDQCPMLLVKVGTGIGAGVVGADGRLHHGTDGAAGDIGHVRVPGGEQVRCRCGSSGCVEALASASAITARLQHSVNGSGPADVAREDVFARIHRGDPAAVALVRESATALGGVVAIFVHFYNPSRVVITGAITKASDHLLAGVRSVVYEQGLPLSTRNLTVAHSVLGEIAGLAGGVVVGIEHALSPAGMARLLDDSGGQLR